MSSAQLASSTISASTSDADLLDYILSISSGVTPTELLSSLKDVQGGLNSKKVGALCVGASMNIRKVVNDLRAKTGVVLPESWLINGEINFSRFAMLGHLIFLLDDSALTSAGVRAKALYTKSIGGVANISMFSDSVEMEGKEERKKILLKWSKQLKNFDIAKYQGILSDKFPNIVADRRSRFGKYLGEIVGALFSPITFLIQATISVLRMAWAVASRSLYIAVIYVIISILVRAFASELVSSAISQVGITGAVVKQDIGMDLFLSSLGDTVGFATRTLAFLAAAFYSTGLGLATGAVSAVANIPSAIEFAQDTVSSRGQNLAKAQEDGIIADFVTNQAANARSILSSTLEDVAEVVFDAKPVVPEGKDFLGLIVDAVLKAADSKKSEDGSSVAPVGNLPEASTERQKAGIARNTSPRMPKKDPDKEVEEL